MLIERNRERSCYILGQYYLHAIINVQWWPADVTPRYPLWPSELECPLIRVLLLHPLHMLVTQSQQNHSLQKNRNTKFFFSFFVHF